MLISNIEKSNFKEMCVEAIQAFCVFALSFTLLITLMFL